jgi:hypothetical protein
MEIVVTAAVCFVIWWASNKLTRKETAKPTPNAYGVTCEAIDATFTNEKLREIFGHDNPAIADWERLGVEYGPGFAHRLMLYDKLYWDWVIGLRREKRIEPSDLVRDFESPRRQQQMAHLTAQASESDEADAVRSGAGNPASG